MEELLGQDSSRGKRKVPPMLQKLLHNDVQLTKKFVEFGLRTTWLRSLRNHAQLFDVSCHGIVWLAGWLTFIWLFNNKELYQLQVNMLIALILDIIVIAVMKAAVRRRRPVPMNKLTDIGPDKFSFPSGHASRSTMIAFILMTEYFNDYFFLYPPFLAWVGAVCLSKVLAERHYLLDVLAGISLGLQEAIFMHLIWFSQSTCAGIVASLSDEKIDGGEYHV
ncbi:unnamed protein product [Chrysodeixis includens]|uniref:Phosphatidic acid phosphatase type 2/haloperoxidase domain-containing protein n=1 Tax=Chrysodeixis includens TaxID=689277 RepID=A0A9P0C271_CHRIL|nr:unnamed protein product [Chrysodeixis includens]